MKGGKEIGLENFEKLKSYFDSIQAEGSSVPMLGDKPNVSAIALACGFDRQVLYKNQKCRTLVEEMVRKIGGVNLTNSQTAHKHDPKDKRLRDLEKLVCDLQEKLEATQKELEIVKPYKRLYEHAQATGRDI